MLTTNGVSVTDMRDVSDDCSESARKRIFTMKSLLCAPRSENHKDGDAFNNSPAICDNADVD